MSVRPAKTQISLGIHPVWSESSLCAQCVAKDPMLLHADSEDSDQTGRMPRLIWVFAGRTAILLVLSCRGSYTLGPKYPRYMHTRTYKQYTWYLCILGSRNTRTYKSKRIHFEHICCLEKKNFCFCFVLKKIFWLLDCEKKKSLFFYRKKILRKKKTSPPPQKIKWSVPKQVFSWRGGSYGVMLFFSLFSLQ